jgi:hypothetical protein
LSDAARKAERHRLLSKTPHILRESPLAAGRDFAAENLLIVDVYARILPEDQIEPIPDPFIEAIVIGKQGPLPAGVQQVQAKTFQIQSASRACESFGTFVGI